MKLTLADIMTGAATIYGEARGCTPAGRVAVAHSILNRCRARAWWGRNVPPYPDHSVSAVCRRAWQFSCWNSTDPNSRALLAFVGNPDDAMSDPVFRGCLRALLEAVDNVEPDATQGATHYLTTSLHTSGRAPAWSQRDDYIQIGAHRFFSGVA